MDTLLADPEIEIVVNLTVPAAHAPVSLQAIEAGKHVYLEKPLATRFAEAKPIMLAAATNGLRIGCAPDTFLGTPTKRVAMRSMKVLSGFLLPVGRPCCRMAWRTGIRTPLSTITAAAINPRYGSLLRDAACQPAGSRDLRDRRGVHRSKTRAITGGPLAGQLITVEVPTTVNGVLSFASGANVALSHSWDIWKHRRQPLEIYGSEGSMLAPDPNFFGGEPQVARRNGEWAPLTSAGMPMANRTGSRVPVRTWLTIASSACSIWRRPSVAGGRIGSAAHLPCMCWKCSMHSNVRRSKAVTS